MNRIGIAAFLFLISGSAALIYQVIWQRILGIFSGVHIYSITTSPSNFGPESARSEGSSRTMRSSGRSWAFPPRCGGSGSR